MKRHCSNSSFPSVDRRSAIALGTSAALAAKTLLGQDGATTIQQPNAAQPNAAKSAAAQSTPISVLSPRDRVPVSFVIDDSTCLVNMGHFCNPQFAEVYPDRDEYKQPWQTWPREIPDTFVREFGQWCAEHGVKGKYSIVPNPACVGWLDRELPGWSRRQLQDSLRLVRDLMVPNWDIHPEMITHTRVIDLKTGRPMQSINPSTMENSFPQQRKSVDELAAYLAYALRILKNCDLPCEGITTPGGFGNMVKEELPVAVHQAVREVYAAELPHYFKYVEMSDQTEPKIEAVSGLDSNDPHVTANVLAATGDWFGGWQGIETVQRDRYLSLDGETGRMAALIKARQPAVMLCHWPGMYNNGTKTGFKAFQSIVETIAAVYGDQTIWMKLSEMGRYWTAKELTKIRVVDQRFVFEAPFAAKEFTVRVSVPPTINEVRLQHGDQTQRCRRVPDSKSLVSNSFCRDNQTLKICFDLAKGNSTILLNST